MNDDIANQGAVDLGGDSQDPIDQDNVERSERVEVLEVDYSQDLQQVQQYQQISIAMSCVICGLILAMIIVGTLRRFL